MEIELHAVERGAGEPLILLHGNGEDGTYFARQMECFCDRFRVIALDTRGHGGSPRGTAPVTLGPCARDLGRGWKVSPCVVVQPEQCFVMADIKGPGAIQQIWVTPTAEQWRHNILRIYKKY